MFSRWRVVFVCLFFHLNANATAIQYCKFLLDPSRMALSGGSGLFVDFIEASQIFLNSKHDAISEPQTQGLVQLLRQADRQSLKESLDDPQRKLFQDAINSVESVIIQNLRRQLKLTHDSLELLAFSVRLLAPRVADDVRVEIGKILIAELRKSPEFGSDILKVLKGWRYRPNPMETVQIMQFVLGQWNNPKVSLEMKVQTFTALPSILGSIPDLILNPFVNEAYQMALNPASGFKYHAVPLLWALLELNPNMSLSLAQQLSKISGFHLPMPRGRDLQVGHATQIQFVSLYFLKVLKTRFLWLEKETQKFLTTAQDPTSPTLIQYRLLQALRLNGVDAQIEYLVPKTTIVVDVFIPFPGAKGKIIEVDGDNHYIMLEDFSKRLMQKDVRRDEVLKELGYVVTRLTNRQAIQEAERLAPERSNTTRPSYYDRPD